MSTTTLINKIKSLNVEKQKEVENFVDFLQYKDEQHIPNEETLQIFKDTDDNKNIHTYSSAEEMLSRLKE